jgi:prevent-host-death family protein
MAKIARNISVAEFSEDPGRAVRRVKGSKSPLVLTKRGRAQAVLLSVETFERNEHERAILQAFARGEKEIASGRSFSLDQVLADADKVLARTRK